MKRVNIALDDDTHTKAKIISLLKKLTLNEYFKGIIEDAVARDEYIIQKELPQEINSKKGKNHVQTRKQTNKQDL